MIATAGAIEGLKSLINVDWSSQYNEQEKVLIKEALKIRQIIAAENTFAFFKILRKGETNYFFACLMLIKMQTMRMTGMSQLLKIGRPYVTDPGLIKSQLNLPSEEQAK